jgi:hypothetical protein
MTNTAILTPEAQAYLDRYLKRVRSALRGHRSVDADDVERDVICHVSAELGQPRDAVTTAQLQTVLERLGNPDQWISADELPLWRRVMLRLRTGPEDWRLPYITFALWAIGPVLGPIGPLFLIASFFTARATVALVDSEGDDLGARRWLVYPPLVIFYLTAVVALLGWPIALVAAAGEELSRQVTWSRIRPLWAAVAGAFLFAPGLWWAITGMLSARFAPAVRAMFYPLANWFEPRHGRRLMLVGFSMFALGGALLFIVVTNYRYI